MILWERGLLDIDANVIQYLPEFTPNNKDSITIRNLLLHNSGLPADAPLFDTYWTRQRVVEWIYNCHLEYPTGSKTVYSDLSMVTL
jgi:CubicO group peptidase (beta-lactamase class C family)